MPFTAKNVMPCDLPGITVGQTSLQNERKERGNGRKRRKRIGLRKRPNKQRESGIVNYKRNSPSQPAKSPKSQKGVSTFF
jgi:hypothetical protein